MRYEFHSHSFLSDGQLHPLEHARRAVAAGQTALAITDHVGATDFLRVVPTLVQECAVATESWKITALPGVEITHVPPARIADVARDARKAGAKIVVVHGETTSEPVPKGTNAAAARCKDVDILAHPGFLAERDLKAAIDTGVLVEITAKRAHAYTNGHVARLIERLDAPFVVGGDVHSAEQFLSEEQARVVALGAGLPRALAGRGLRDHPRALLKRRA